MGKRCVIGITVDTETDHQINELVKSGRFRTKSHLGDEAIKFYLHHLHEQRQMVAQEGSNGQN